ncbi:MAG: hypothetical protein A2170_11360 [Deltaproteobacteria bacterium RBG_13_53_10]|nr:MAG: hypothetical protein A2170_11360 [Deltaproteobacteria bacterium RBG_13_53_10]
MTRLNRISSLFLMGFSVIIFFSSLQLGIGNPKSPGPGFAPLLASVLVFSLSLLVLIQGMRVSEEKKRRPKDRNYLLKPTFLVLAVLGYSFLLNVLGYLVTAFLLMFAMFSIGEPKKLSRNLIIAAIVIIMSFILFRKLLGVQLPKGIFLI